jgi:hypothetical protein
MNAEQKELLKKFDDAMTGRTDNTPENTDSDNSSGKGKKKFWK